MDGVPMVIPVILVIFGLGFTGIGVYLVIDHIRLIKSCTKFINGAVIGNEEKISKQKKMGSALEEVWIYYYPIISFSINGVEYKRTSDIGRGSLGHHGTPKYREGEKIEIAYNPDDPQQFYIVKDKILGKFAAIGFTIVGLGTMAIGLLMLLKRVTQG